jgi:DnaJ-class molecular chaperone
MKIKELLESMTRQEAASIFNRYGVKNSEVLSQEQLKKLYLALSKKNHPDLGGSDKAMKEINTAYDVLSKPVEKTVASKPTSKWTPPKWAGNFAKEWENFDKKKKEQDKKPESPKNKHVDIFV